MYAACAGSNGTAYGADPDAPARSRNSGDPDWTIKMRVIIISYGDIRHGLSIACGGGTGAAWTDVDQPVSVKWTPVNHRRASITGGRKRSVRGSCPKVPWLGEGGCLRRANLNGALDCNAAAAFKCSELAEGNVLRARVQLLAA